MMKRISAFLTSLACLTPCLFSVSAVSAEDSEQPFEMVVVGVDDAENPQNYVIIEYTDSDDMFPDTYYMKADIVEAHYKGTEEIAYGDILEIPYCMFATNLIGTNEMGLLISDSIINKIGSVFNEGITTDYTIGIGLEHNEAILNTNDKQFTYCFDYTQNSSYLQPDGIDWTKAKDGDIVTMYTYNGYPTIPASITPLGDANLDGSLDVLDVIVLNRNIMGLSSLPGVAARSTDFGQADFNGDGVIDGSDSLGVMKRIVGLE